jgi:hypothetical protein
MATIEFTEEALALARRLMDGMNLEFEHIVPVVFVRWSGGAMDLTRSPGGHASWVRDEPAGWTVGVAPWGLEGPAKVEDCTIKMEGLYVLLEPGALRAPGAFLVSAFAGVLCVEHRQA